MSLTKNRLTALLLALILTSTPLAAASPKHIAITQFVEHVAADAVREGLLKELTRQGYTLDKDLIVHFENAQGNVATAGQIAKKFLGLKPDVIVAITTPSAQAVVKTIGQDSIPVVFSAVTDPVGAGLVVQPAGHVTGVKDAPPIKEQIEFIKVLIPTAKKIGLLYNPGDSGSVASLETIRQQAKLQGLEILEATPLRSSDLQAAVLKFVGQVDAVYVPLDNMVVSAMPTVASLALKHQLPLFVADSGSVEAGALACVGYSYPAVGVKTGEMVGAILKGQDPAAMAVTSPDKKDIFINRHAAQTLKISIPPHLQKEVIER